MSPQKPPVHWISHRGYHSQFTENSKGAFDEACSRGFTHLETDLRLSRDGVLILCHDPNLARVGGPSRLLSTMSAEEIGAQTLPGGDKVLRFEEFYRCYGERCQVTLDVKPEGGLETTRVFLAWVEAQGAEQWVRDKVTFLFWRAAHEALMAERFPRARFYARREECWRAGAALLLGLPQFGGIKARRIYAMPPRFLGRRLYTTSILAAVHRFGGRVVAFLPESSEDVQAAIAAGVDEILTNGLIEAPQL